MFEMIMDWVIEPLLEFLDHRGMSGKWHVSHLFPVATAAFGGICWLGEHWGIGFLIVIGALGVVLFGLVSLLTWIPRQVRLWRDTQDYIAKRKWEARKIEAQEAAEREAAERKDFG